MDFNLPPDLLAYLSELDAFILREIKPLEEQDDNIRFFDHRREWARTDFENVTGEDHFVAKVVSQSDDREHDQRAA